LSYFDILFSCFSHFKVPSCRAASRSSIYFISTRGFVRAWYENLALMTDEDLKSNCGYNRQKEERDD